MVEEKMARVKWFISMCCGSGAHDDMLAAVREYGLAVHEETVTATCNDMEEAAEILFGSLPSEVATLRALLAALGLSKRGEGDAD